jgi:hypothetical protein
MDGKPGGAGPALAAHSKDASTPGQTPASQASASSPPANVETVVRLADQLAEFVRQQPLAAMAAALLLGATTGKIFGRR